MSLIEIILIAISLSMDAFAISMTIGICGQLSVGADSVRPIVGVDSVRPAFFFGFSQALMPIIGYYAGIYIVDQIKHLDHWIIFGLLSIIGGKMLKESFTTENQPKTLSLSFLSLLFLAIATSIDALAVGITFAFFEINIFYAATLIGVVTFFISISGVKIGEFFGSKYRSKAEILGGTILILLGVKVLIEHLLV